MSTRIFVHQLTCLEKSRVVERWLIGKMRIPHFRKHFPLARSARRELLRAPGINVREVIPHEKNMRQNCGIKYFHKGPRLRGRPASSCHVYVHLGKWDTPVVSRGGEGEEGGAGGKTRSIFLKMHPIYVHSYTGNAHGTGIVIARLRGAIVHPPRAHSTLHCGRLIMNRIYLIRRTYSSPMYIDKMGIGCARWERKSNVNALQGWSIVSLIIPCLFQNSK